MRVFAVDGHSAARAVAALFPAAVVTKAGRE